MAADLRKTGISVVEGTTWGNRGSLFYDTRQDLLDAVIPFFKTGLEDGDFCLWIISEPLTEEVAIGVLRQSIPDRLQDKLDQVLANGYAGMRATGDAGGAGEPAESLRKYEAELNKFIAVRRIAVLCIYPLATSRAAEMLSGSEAHQVAATVRNGDWEIIETPDFKQAQAQTNTLNQQLESKVANRTRALRLSNETENLS